MIVALRIAFLLARCCWLALIERLYPVSPLSTIVGDAYYTRGHVFHFRHILQPDGTYQAYCYDCPLNRRSSSPPDCHIYRDGRISINEQARPRTLDRSKAIARYWAEGYVDYQRTGVFPNGKRQIEV
jgi:hypothetical protein